MYKYLFFLLTVISFQSLSSTTQYVKVSQNFRSYTIPVEEGLTPEQTLTQYRPTDPNDEVEGSWNKNKTSYSYNSFSGYKLKGHHPFAISEGYGDIKVYEGDDIESLVSKNSYECSNDKYKTTKIEYNDDKSAVRLTYEKCNLKEGARSKTEKSCF